MDAVDKALQTQLTNIQKKTGRTLDQLYALIKKSKLEKHGQIRDMLMADVALGHGDANTIAVMYSRSLAPAPAGGTSIDAIVDGFYSGPKAELRPIHDKVMAAINKLGDFETSPKKTYLSLRRKKQFAMVGPATKTRVEVGINAKGLKSGARLIELPPGQMCQYKVGLTSASEVDAELIGWIRSAYDAAG